MGYAPSFIPLGLRYQCGTGTEKSKEKAAFWFYKAEEAGIENARDYLMLLWEETWSEKYNGNKVQDRNSPRKRPNR